MYHTQLEVWKTSMELLVMTYEFTAKMPKQEQYGFVSQMNRAALSVPSNISEGAARNSTKDYVRFLYMALGSIAELETQYIASQMINIIEEDVPYKNKIDHVSRLLLAQLKALKLKLQ